MNFYKSFCFQISTMHIVCVLYYNNCHYIENSSWFLSPLRMCSSNTNKRQTLNSIQFNSNHTIMLSNERKWIHKCQEKCTRIQIVNSLNVKLEPKMLTIIGLSTELEWTYFRTLKNEFRCEEKKTKRFGAGSIWKWSFSIPSRIIIIRG